MLNGAKATSMLPAVDLARARKFYEETLGLRPGAAQPGGAVQYEAGGARFALYPRPAPTRADHTALSFEVQDLSGEMRSLRARGVRFEEYDLPGLKTVEGVCVLGAERAAWFHDSEGNILCLHQDG